ncbi:MAG: N-acetylneuraminate synthase family protein [Bacteroidota bacterium]|nr:N-acetylneuraminate synthase family protein [Bacteroidota bacterium]
MNLIEYFKIKQNNLEVPYIIAEAGVNHEGSMDLAKRLIDEALEGGANSIKFQTYKAETIASKDSPYYWDLSKESTRSQYELFKKYDSFWKKEFEELKVYCDKAGIEFLSTPFDAESARFLNDLMPVFKISSSDITNLPFIELQCSFGKPIILSTGASFLWEIQQAVEVIEKYGNPLCLMHCVLNYPTSDENANIGMIKGLINHFPKLLIGYSDHTIPGDSMDICYDSWLIGAQIIEKHFTHDKKLPGNDHYHAMDKNDLRKFVTRVENAKKWIGITKVSALPEEEPARKNARRSLVANNDIPKGKIISADDLTWKRPAHGISPVYFNIVCGSIANKDILEDDLIQWSDIITK